MPPQEVRAHHILVKDDHTCQALSRRLAEDATQFAALARAHSQCPSGRRGGGLGTFGRGQMVPAFEEVVFDLEVGEISGCFPTPFGHHVVQRTG